MSKPPSQLWLGVHFFQLALDSHLRGIAEPPPCAISVRDKGRDVVWQCNRAAQQAGIKVGMAMAQAQALCAELRPFSRRPAEETNLLRQLADGFWRFSSQLALTPPDMVLLEVGASLQLFGGLQALVDQLREQLKHSGFSAHCGLAPSPTGAELFAREGQGRCVTKRCEMGASLRELPLSLAQLSNEHQRALQAAGIQTLGGLCALPADARLNRFGKALEEQLQRLLGGKADPRPAYRPAERFRGELLLPTPVSGTEALRFAAQRLMADLDHFLLARQKGIQQFSLRLGFEERHLPDARVEVGLASIGREREHWQMLLTEKLQQLSLKAAVERLALETGPLFDLRPSDRDLFGPRDRQQPAGALVERLRARLGQQRVQTLASVPDHRPERAWRYQRDVLNASASVQQPPGRRPFWLLPHAQPLRESPQNLTLLSGPERIESGWWDQHDTRRDYYIARTTEGRHLWVYQELAAPRRWFVHGLFD
jgi:protein ImuB